METRQQAEPYSTSFTSIPRQRTLAIWSTHQVVIAFVLAFIFTLGLTGGRPPVSVPSIILGGILVLDLLVIRGLSVWQLLGIRLGFLVLQATGGAQATISPLTVNTTVGLLDIPGNDGRNMSMYKIVNTRFDGACFIWDEATGEATACLHLRGLSSQLDSTDHLNSLGSKFSAILASLADQPDVSRITIQSRALRKPVKRTDADHDADASLAERDIDIVENDLIGMPIEHDYIVTISVNPKKAKGDYEASATPDAVSKLLSDRTEQLSKAIVGVGAKPGAITWVNMAQLRGLMKTLTDPTAFSMLDQYGQLPDDVPLALSWKAHSTYMEVGSLFARTRWVDHWPSDPVPVGWLQDVSASPSVQLIFTQVFRSRSESSAKNQVERQLNETETMKKFNGWAGRQADRKTEDEIIALDRHLHDIAADRGDVQFQGFLTVLSDSKQQLDTDCRAVDVVAGKYMHLDPMRNQQLARFNGVWPLGMEGRQA